MLKTKCPLTRTNDQGHEVDCGYPNWTDASDYCEIHYKANYPGSYERLKSEIRCPECKDKPEFAYCGLCNGRKWVSTIIQ